MSQIICQIFWSMWIHFKHESKLLIIQKVHYDRYDFGKRKMNAMLAKRFSKKRNKFVCKREIYFAIMHRLKDFEFERIKFLSIETIDFRMLIQIRWSISNFDRIQWLLWMSFECAFESFTIQKIQHDWNDSKFLRKFLKRWSNLMINKSAL